MTVQVPYPLPARQDITTTRPLERDYVELDKEYGGLVHGAFPFGGVGWMAISYEDVKSVLSDPRFGLEIAEQMGDYPRIRFVEVGPPFPFSFPHMDPPRHTKKRNHLMRHLTVKRVQGHRPHTRDVVESFLDEIDASGIDTVDLSGAYARRVPLRVLSDLLGVPVEEHYRFVDAAYFIANGKATTLEEAEQALGQMLEYFRELVARRRAEPKDDLISVLANDPETLEVWSEDELDAAGSLLLLAGHDATASTLGGILEWLAHSPELYARLRSEPEKFPAYLEEFLRFIPAGLAGTRSRIALEDVMVGSQLVRKGEAVLPIVHAANFDYRAFQNPLELDLEAQRENLHVGFGYGPHGCLGMQLARMEIDEAIRAVMRRYSSIESLDPHEDWDDRRLLRGPESILVKLTRAADNA